MRRRVHLRPLRLREKQRAGAALAVLNHVGSAERLAAFAGRGPRGRA